jgi:hypothetical protein
MCNPEDVFSLARIRKPRLLLLRRRHSFFLVGLQS